MPSGRILPDSWFKQNDLAVPKRRLRVTHTYVTLDVSPAAYDEIAGLLRAAGYDHAFNDKGEIDMHGIALTKGDPGE
jgi:hypothetical protein